MINLVQYDESRFPWSGIYFHGQCEEFVSALGDSPGDLAGSIETENPPEGIHDVFVYGKLAQAYVWKTNICRYLNIKDGFRKRGLIVFPEDKESVALAISLFAEKKPYL